MKTAKVVLAGQEYEIKELKTRRLSEWLKELEGPVSDALSVVSEALSYDAEGGDDESSIALASRVTSLLAGSVDKVLDLMVSFAPDLEKAINDCYTSEAVPAFVEVLKLAVPFDLKESQGLIKKALLTIWELKETGHLDNSTGMNSPSQNGESGQTQTE